LVTILEGIVFLQLRKIESLRIQSAIYNPINYDSWNNSTTLYTKKLTPKNINKNQGCKTNKLQPE